MRLNKNFRFPFPDLLLWVSFLILIGSCAPYKIQGNKVSLIDVDESVAIDSSYLHLIDPYKEQLDKEMGEVIAHGKKELKKNMGESTLGNLVADMQWVFSEKKFGHAVDISVINHGGLRNSLPEGDITVGNIFELSPFENRIYLLELTYDDVEKLANYTVKGKNLGIAGLNVESRNGELQKFTVGGKAVEKHRTYTLAINDYLANGGDRMDFLIPLPRIVESDVLLREMLMDEIKKWTAEGRPIDAQIEGRQKLD